MKTTTTNIVSKMMAAKSAASRWKKKVEGHQSNDQQFEALGTALEKYRRLKFNFF